VLLLANIDRQTRKYIATEAGSCDADAASCTVTLRWEGGRNPALEYPVRESRKAGRKNLAQCFSWIIHEDFTLWRGTASAMP